MYQHHSLVRVNRTLISTNQTGNDYNRSNLQVQKSVLNVSSYTEPVVHIINTTKNSYNKKFKGQWA